MKRSFQFRGRCLSLGEKPLIMGIVNVTPDSFFDGGTHDGTSEAVEHAMKLIAEGADIIDVGGESTRPGHTPVDSQTERQRVVPVIQAIRSRSGIPVSIDTMKADVMAAAFESGADILNDVSGLAQDQDEKCRLLQNYGGGCVVMHSAQRPPEIQDSQYVQWVADWLASSIRNAEELSGLDSTHFMVDPGIGFAKSDAENLMLLANLERLADSEYPILLGISRKSFIGRICTLDSPEDRFPGTAAATAIGDWLQADIHRVHDVAAISQVLQTAWAIRRYRYQSH